MIENLEQLDRAIQELKPWDDACVHVSLVNHCGSLKSLPLGKLLHSRLSRSGRDRDTYVGNHLIQMYGKCSSLERALQVFTNLQSRNVYSWNMLISAYAQNGEVKSARRAFNAMAERDAYSWTTMISSWNALLTAYVGKSSRAAQTLSEMELEGLTPNKITFVSIFSSFTAAENLQTARSLHWRILAEKAAEVDVGLENSLIAMYGRCGSLIYAERTFGGMRTRNVVSWTSLISLYANTGLGAEAVRAFRLMDLDGVQPNFITFTSAVEACTRAGDLTDGRILHQIAAVAREIFDGMNLKNVQSWSSMIAAYAQSGDSESALEIFSAMGVEGQIPNMVTFVVVLVACVHAGKLEDGWSYFVSIRRDYGITLVPDHYNCMVDLLARTGKLDEAQDQDAGKGRFAAEPLVLLGSHNASPYMLLSNIMAVFCY